MVMQTSPQTETSGTRFTGALEQSEQRIRTDFTATLDAMEEHLTTALKQSEQRTIEDFRRNIKESEQRIMIAIEDAKVSTIRWIVGSTVAISFVMIGCISGAVIWVAP